MPDIPHKARAAQYLVEMTLLTGLWQILRMSDFGINIIVIHRGANHATRLVWSPRKQGLPRLWWTLPDQHSLNLTQLTHKTSYLLEVRLHGLVEDCTTSSLPCTTLLPSLSHHALVALSFWTNRQDVVNVGPRYRLEPCGDIRLQKRDQPPLNPLHGTFSPSHNQTLNWKMFTWVLFILVSQRHTTVRIYKPTKLQTSWIASGFHSTGSSYLADSLWVFDPIRWCFWGWELHFHFVTSISDPTSDTRISWIVNGHIPVHWAPREELAQDHHPTSFPY